MDAREWVDVAIRGIHLVGALGLLAVLTTLSLGSWRAVRDPELAPGWHAMRQRLLAPLWIVIGVLASTGLYNHFHNVPFALPRIWNLQDVTLPYGKPYMLLLLGKHVFVVQMILGLAVVTWRLAGSPSGRRRGVQTADLGTALISTLSLVSGVFILLTTAVLGHVHLLIHGHP